MSANRTVEVPDPTCSDFGLMRITLTTGDWNGSAVLPLRQASGHELIPSSVPDQGLRPSNNLVGRAPLMPTSHGHGQQHGHFVYTVPELGLTSTGFAIP